MTPPRIPFILYGDGPRLRSGLARIARDLAARLYTNQEELGIRFMQIGVDYPDGWHWQPWDFYGFQPTMQDQGWGALKRIEDELKAQGETERPIVLAIMDPSRVYDLVREHERYTTAFGETLQMDIWGYFPIDAHNLQGAVGGPAAEAVRMVDRVLAYGPYGARILKRTLMTKGVSFLPHGLEPGLFTPQVGLEQAHDDFRSWIRDTRVRQALVVGCVATNQARKDLGLFYQTIGEIKARGHQVACWLQTDKLTNAWDIGQLVTTCGLTRNEVLVSTEELSDTQLAAQYAASDVTIAPGLGEGFGYPIVESLSCGTPVIHGAYAGGVDLIQNPRWLIEPLTYRLEGIYALQRPVFSPGAFADAVLEAARLDRQPTAAYCTGMVAHLSWAAMWPRWQAWIQQGLAARRGGIDGQRGEAESVQPGTGEGCGT